MSIRIFTRALLIITLSVTSFLLPLRTSHAALVFEGQPLSFKKPLTDGQTLKLVLRIYNDQYNGQILYEEKQEVEIISNTASFKFEKGEILSPNNTLKQSPENLWVEVESNDQILSPRLNLAELDTEVDLTGTNQDFSRSSLRTVGTSALIIDSDGVSLDGSQSSGLLRVENDTTYGEGLYGKVTSKGGTGVQGVATYNEDGFSYGGQFSAQSSKGIGVKGMASGNNGSGVMGVGLGTSSSSVAIGVKGISSANLGRGVYGEVTGTNAVGVYGLASSTSTNANQKSYGGYFDASAKYGRGVHCNASGSEGVGLYSFTSGTNATSVYGRSNGSSSRAIHGKHAGTSGSAVFGEAIKTGDYSTCGGVFTSAGDKGTGVYGSGKKYGAKFESSDGVGIDVTGKTYGGRFRASVAEQSGSIGVYGEGESAGGKFHVDSFGGNAVIATVTGDHCIGVNSTGGHFSYDFYAGGTGTNYGPFTGAHDVQLAEDFAEETVPGMIVSVTGETEARILDDGTAALSSTLPTVALTDKAQDKAVFGILVCEETLPEGHWHKSLDGERFGIVNALGEGRVWVTNVNGDIEAGDYITTSNIAGYGQLQDDDIIHSYTVGKAIETVDWETVTETITIDGQEVKIFLIAVVYMCG